MKNKNHEDIVKIHEEVIGLAQEMSKTIDSYFEKNTGDLLTNNDKFLVVSRAINVHAKKWFEHFYTQFDPTSEENKKKLAEANAISN